MYCTNVWSGVKFSVWRSAQQRKPLKPISGVGVREKLVRAAPRLSLTVQNGHMESGEKIDQPASTCVKLTHDCVVLYFS